MCMTATSQRALRLSGQEPAGKGRTRPPGPPADDLVLRKIAQAGLSGLSALIKRNGAGCPRPRRACGGPRGGGAAETALGRCG